ncbi:polysaccharide deacetylase family protein [Sporosarcina sp. Te-1]|uniref:polysaccharide deacetylase family protein n=1 Tax=Sporosarcina sp. Te-1 TaxID=2818390 RepID=UPI001A9DBB16|nr:polysaccharide deacetylase family protein [Sporosarcina sp. Te-1]QTD40662.1 polysaccharide deacetylase family protein [Sporosarcina sp. Te-1]
MKRLIIPLILILFVFGVYDRTFADKGRKYYEEAGQIIWEINTKEKVIALTFDDGPHRKYTAEILDLLKKHEAKATFFIVGANAEKNPEVVLRMYEEGHELANHTYSHKSRMSVSRLIQELKKTDETIYAITGYSSTLFRPVEGVYTDEIVDAVSKEGYQLVMWSWHLDTLDWKNPGVNKIVKFVLDGAKEGNVVLFHDGGGNRRQTVAALEKILPELAREGYTFVTISDMMRIKEQNQKDEDKQIELPK